MKDVLVALNNVEKRFLASKKMFRENKYVHAINGISFDIRQGETFALVGESGCGKSTTGRLINRLLEPDRGEIWFHQENISNYSSSQMKPLRKKMQMVFQDPYGSLNPRMRISEIVGEPLLVHTNLTAKERYRKVMDLLEIVGLNERHAQSYAHEFSGGQRQRIGIARALTVNPSLVIADEPVSALDVSIQAQVINLFKNLQKEFQLTYLFISHDLSVVENISDRIGVMYLGKIMELTSKEKLYKEPLHPYTKALLSAIPIADPTLKRERILLKGDIPNPIDLPSGCPFHTRCPHAFQRCVEETPELKEVKAEHKVACHLSFS
ncbi:peptide/nickel transport system ATP-binding protein/oligopeptide transport system ATP-binding protein [Tindallia magadiensis]|uniref:Peptide/nickel transport system ATP-binding protein/oligopeptide transport system ATP-binding protein n=1 Tax=Tindallia magadiensis TaxID=69895 RepID=A0A1I3HMV9_9FIRM|nr:dipeptide ABC transporter ATP-binding protein [Tindallia magadiensis]SFI36963.1 peptide/nickel transport system ATP-binding protein/oligopeptide transport system ATP-binding protein [Tindallia magadiensis]